MQKWHMTESFILLHTFVCLWVVLLCNKQQPSLQFILLDSHLHPSSCYIVDVLVSMPAAPTHQESFLVLKRQTHTYTYTDIYFRSNWYGYWAMEAGILLGGPVLQSHVVCRFKWTLSRQESLKDIPSHVFTDTTLFLVSFTLGFWSISLCH